MMEETISAISTPPGEGGIGIVRISGENAKDILSKIFRPFTGSSLEPRKLTYGRVVDPESGSEVDEVLAVFMPAPHTYTKEDIVEIDCHGGIIPLRETLGLTYRYGARPANPGEFTERAFLNGRIDLSQAEAVMDLISAKSERSSKIAMRQMDGSLSEEIRNLRNVIMDILVNLTVNIDYPDEDIEIMTYEKLAADLGPVSDEIGRLLSGSDTGRVLRDGIRISIIGKPNVGKSSLMNRLLKESRAIVTEIPGTTRDTIEENLTIRGIPAVLTDTAGIRETEDRIESIGIERSKEAGKRADLVFLLLDGSRPLDEEDRFVMNGLDPDKTLVILNKCDLPKQIGQSEIAAFLPEVEIIESSMTEGKGISDIEDAVERRVYHGEVSSGESVLVSNARHIELLRSASDQIKNASEMVQRKEPFEIIELAVSEAYENLGEIIGEEVGDDILNEVFSRFCLGK